MELTPVQSTNICGVGYDEETRVLRIQFHKQNRIYEYLDVPPEVHQSLMKAESKGSFFQKRILKVYVGKRIE